MDVNSSICIQVSKKILFIRHDKLYSSSKWHVGNFSNCYNVGSTVTRYLRIKCHIKSDLIYNYLNNNNNNDVLRCIGYNFIVKKRISERNL